MPSFMRLSLNASTSCESISGSATAPKNESRCQCTESRERSVAGCSSVRAHARYLSLKSSTSPCASTLSPSVLAASLSLQLRLPVHARSTRTGCQSPSVYRRWGGLVGNLHPERRRLCGPSTPSRTRWPRLSAKQIDLLSDTNQPNYQIRSVASSWGSRGALAILKQCCSNR